MASTYPSPLGECERFSSCQSNHRTTPCLSPSGPRRRTSPSDSASGRSPRCDRYAPFGSPKTPRTVYSGQKPRNAYVSHSRRFRFAEFAIQTRRPIQAVLEMPETDYPCGFPAHLPLKLPPKSQRPQKLDALSCRVFPCICDAHCLFVELFFPAKEDLLVTTSRYSALVPGEGGF